LIKNVPIAFDSKISKDVLTKVNFDFIGVRKKFYIISSIVIVIGLGSLLVRGLSYGVDFSGGRSYVVRFDE
jgi:SecD/SecF fusion protein